MNRLDTPIQQMMAALATLKGLEVARSVCLCAYEREPNEERLAAYRVADQVYAQARAEVRRNPLRINANPLANQ